MATKKTPKVINPITGKPLRPEAAKYVSQARTVRRAARNAARSGHPGHRAEALQTLAGAPELIRRTYISEAGR